MHVIKGGVLKHSVSISTSFTIFIFDFNFLIINLFKTPIKKIILKFSLKFERSKSKATVFLLLFFLANVYLSIYNIFVFLI